jgi:hypothetical protein
MAIDFAADALGIQKSFLAFLMMVFGPSVLGVGNHPWG